MTKTLLYPIAEGGEEVAVVEDEELAILEEFTIGRLSIG